MRKFYFLGFTFIFSAIANAKVTCIKLLFHYSPGFETSTIFDNNQVGKSFLLNGYFTGQTLSKLNKTKLINTFIKRTNGRFISVWDNYEIEINSVVSGYPHSKNILNA